MLKNYIRIAWRNLLRDKIFSSINILGLATAMAITLSIIEYARFEFSYEDTHKKADRIVRISMDYMDGEVVTFQDAASYGLAGPRISSDFPEVEHYTFVSPLDPLVFEIGDSYFKQERVFISNSQFFDVFTYPFTEGNPGTALENPFELVITKSVAEKFFPNRSALNQELILAYQGKDYAFKVAGVVNDSPSNSHLKFEVLISYPTVNTLWDYRKHNWDNNNEYNYFLLKDSKAYTGFTAKLAELNETLWKEGEIPEERIVAQPLKDIHLYSDKGYEMEPPGNATAVFFLLAIAAFVILIAWVNYINLSTAKSLDRAREVGIRKVVGSTARQLQYQFLTEASLSNIIAGILAVSIMQLGMPFFKDLTSLPESLVFISDPTFWLLTIVLVLSSVILSGWYPAFALSAYQPSMVLKGKFSSSQTGQRLRKLLVILQFTLTTALLTGTLTINEQIYFMKEKDLGMNLTNKLIVDACNDFERDHVEVFRNELNLLPDVQSVSFSEAIPGSEEMLSSKNGVFPIGWEKENNYNFFMYRIDEDYFDTYDMAMATGDNFSGDLDNSSSIIINEESARLWEIYDLDKAIGLKVQLWGMERTIIGVVNDFHQISVKSPLLPMIFMHTDVEYGPWTYATLGLGDGKITDQIQDVRKAYEKAFPTSAFSYQLMDSRYNIQYRSDERFFGVFRVMSGLAILIAALGLFGLVGFSVTSRTKEIGIRKVLGASISQIIVLLSSSFFQLVTIAAIIAVPVSYIAINEWLMSYAYRIDIHWTLFAIPLFLIFLVAILSISMESWKAAKRNPVEALRYE